MDNNDVKTGRRLSATGAYHRALDVARKFEATGLGDGQCLIVIHDACNTHRKVPRAGTVQNTLVVMVVDSTKVHASTKDSVRGQEYESLKGTNGFAAQPA